ncbi:hypothetical protein DM02DRAFT_327421 [Periconia macrospinosa]|uniref:Osmotin, thaumatin-like protein n=1 Tax=Periconia macrospinosa TaxID=97972 RepID=A0A2V1EDX1_9PLEO|nr:hypothetical protein DM02DRAFT_327421 [Periconia macrospinosa]
MWTIHIATLILGVSASPTIPKGERPDVLTGYRVNPVRDLHHARSGIIWNTVQKSSRPLHHITRDEGATYGNVKIVNNCGKTLYMVSVGSRNLGGDNSTDHAPKDLEVISLPPDNIYTEPYRTVCFTHPSNAYCPGEDKLGGQGVSMKIAASNDTWTHVTQIEYSLVKNTDRKDNFYRLNYDISLLDCGIPKWNTSDATATSAEHQLKLDKCPGYQGGISVNFDSDPNHENCMPLQCDGKQRCPQMYFWDRTRGGEASVECSREYRGDMRVELCANRGKNAAKDKAAFSSYTATANHELIIAQQTAGDYDSVPQTPSTTTSINATPPVSSVSTVVTTTPLINVPQSQSLTPSNKTPTSTVTECNGSMCSYDYNGSSKTPASPGLSTSAIHPSSIPATTASAPTTTLTTTPLQVVVTITQYNTVTSTMPQHNSLYASSTAPSSPFPVPSGYTYEFFPTLISTWVLVPIRTASSPFPTPTNPGDT